MEGVITDQSFELGRVNITQAGKLGHAGLAQRILGQSVGEQVKFTRLGPAFFLGRIHTIEAIGDLRVIGDGLVRRDRPGGRGPDHHAGVQQLEIVHLPRVFRIFHRMSETERHPDRVRLVIVIFNLGLGQRGLFDRRPHHGFRPLIQRAVHQELHEFLGDDRFGVEVHGQIRIGPVACHTQTLEFLALDVDPALGELAAFLAEIDDWHVVLVLALLAVLFFNLPFDRKAVTVPAGHVARIKPHHLMAAHNHVLDRLVQRVTDVQMPVGIGRSVMQRKRRAGVIIFARPGEGLFAQAVIDADLFPTGQPFGFPLGQARAHGEIGLRQAQRVFVFGGVGTHVSGPFQENSGMFEGAARSIIRLVPAARAIRAPGL